MDVTLLHFRSFAVVSHRITSRPCRIRRRRQWPLLTMILIVAHCAIIRPSEECFDPLRDDIAEIT